MLENSLRKYLTDNQLRFLRYIVYTLSVGKQFIVPSNCARCNICNYEGSFRPFGHPPRYGAECVRCGSKERHRLLKHWWDDNPHLTGTARTLHFAPEPSVQRFVKPAVKEYQSADLDPGRAELLVDIEAISLPDESYDLIICSHVLEHVDDRKALSGLYRILTRGGLLIVMVPIVEAWKTSYENNMVVAPKERVLHFGQSDHVRIYGHDLRDRIRRGDRLSSPNFEVFAFAWRDGLHLPKVRTAFAGVDVTLLCQRIDNQTCSNDRQALCSYHGWASKSPQSRRQKHD
jgi:SAM-dependent methyltransferase